MPQNQRISPNESKKPPVIVLTGGGSGGHITPLLSLAHALRAQNPDCNIIYIGHKGDKFDSLQERYHDFNFLAFVNGGKFRRYHGESFLSHLLDFKTLLLNARDFFRLIASIGKAWRILAKVHPDVVFSKGSFVAVPVGIAAHLRHTPIVTHDSDAVPGLANRIIGRWATVHATGMPAQFYDYPKETIIYTGIPIDERIKPASPALQQKVKVAIGVDPNGLVLLVAGGGLGSQSINQKILSIAPELLTVNPKLYIIHVTGLQHEEKVRQQYAKLNSLSQRVTVLGFTPDFYQYVAAADLIVSRAGATMIAEFAAAHKACLIIPNPFLASGHQLKNAEELEKLGAVEVAAEDISPEELLGKIVKLLANAKRRKIIASRLGAQSKANASTELSNILLKIAK